MLLRAILRKLLRLAKRSAPVQYRIGNVKYHNSDVDSLVPQLVEIGDNFISAPGSIILAHDASLLRLTGCYRCERTRIGNDVFLGANAVVLPGVTIGDGAIVGAGAVVTRNVEPHTVVAGNPARMICTVREYAEKCRRKRVLVEAPESFDRVWRNERPRPQDIKDLQDRVLRQCIDQSRDCRGLKKHDGSETREGGEYGEHERTG